jgi:hypothetical protein
MGDFDWKIWSWKLVKGLGITIGATACLYVADYITVNPFPEEYVFWGGLVIIGLQQIGNYIKHTFLT